MDPNNRTPKGQSEHAQVQASSAGRHRKIRSQLFFLVAAVVAPLIGLLGYAMYTDAKQDLRQAGVLSVGLARTAAWHIHESLEDVEEQLALLASQSAIQTLDPEHCELLSKHLLLHPVLSNIVTLDREGSLVCSADTAQQNAASSYARASWFERSLHENTFAMSNAAPASETNRRLFVYAYPIHDGEGRTSGVIAFSVDFASYLARMTPAIPKTSSVVRNGSTYQAQTPLLQELVYWIIDEKGTAIARFPAAGNEDWNGAHQANLLPDLDHEHFISLDADGVERVHGLATVPGLGLRVAAAIPSEAVLAEMRQEVLHDGFLATLIVLSVLALAWVISRRITLPIKGIAEVAGKIAEGHLETRAQVDGAAEIAEVAVQFNKMLDIRRQEEEALKHTSQRCQMLSHQLLQIREQERRHIARELHDEIGQALTAVKINLQAMGRQSGAQMPSPHMENCIQIVEAALHSVRGLSLDLCPPILDDLGLPAALRWQLDCHARPAGLAVHFSHSLDSRPDRDLEMACFRIAQEAITNVIRHAEAAEIQVDLHQRDASLKLAIYDDGKGFDVPSVRQQALNGKSMGLFSMEERVKLLGGRFFLDSAPGRGTGVRAVFPLATAAETAALRGVA